MNYSKATKAQLIERCKELEENRGKEPAEMKVTKVTIYPFKEGPSLGHMKGMAVIVLNDQFMVRGLRIMSGENGLYVGYPNDPFYRGDEDFHAICQPITRTLREAIEDAVLTKYKQAIG